MSLEAKIEKLTNAVEALTERLHAMEAMVAVPPSAPTEQPQEKPEAEPAEAEPAEDKPAEAEQKELTHDEVQQLCLKIVRSDRSKKKALKNVLAEYGASIVADVPAEKLPELKEKLEAV